MTNIMKIGILTQPLHSNYGGLLQNYALQQILIAEGHEVETLDWGKSNTLHSKLYHAKIKFLTKFLPKKYPKLRYQPSKNELSVICKNTNYFINKYIKHTVKLHSYSQFKKQAIKGKYNAYIVGSDQCWRPMYNTFLSSMFLDFTESSNVKRLAYAASFGTVEWEFSPQQTSICSNLVKKFDLVTVREDSGVILCNDYLGVEAMHVLDPTMLLTKEDYIKLINDEKEPKSQGSLFNYILDPDDDKKAFIDKISKETKLQLFKVLPKCQAETRTREDVKKRINDCVFPTVTSWLRAFMDAEMVICDSFHGCVFSIIFNKPFWVIGNSKRGMSRFTSLLKTFNLEDRLLDQSNLHEADYTKQISWDRVNNILVLKRKECKSLLLNELS